jgi:hypothetical protein
MPDFNISTNMNLPIPVPTVAPGPEYAINEQSCFNLIDTHNHTSGQGVQIPAAALNIDGNLPMNGNTLESCAGVVLENQSTTPATNTIYSVGGNLYYQNGLNQVQITSGSSVNAAAGNITGLASPASVTWSAGTVSYIFKSTATNYADLDLRNVLLRNTGASTYKMTVSPPSAMASDYTVTLPTPPASTSFMTMDSSGTVGVSIPTSLGIQTANIADSAITTIKIADGNVTPAKLSAANIVTDSGTLISTTSTTYVATGFSLTIVCTGRPVLIMLSGDSWITSVTSGVPTTISSSIKFKKDGADLKVFTSGIAAANGSSALSITQGLTVSWIDVPAAGSRTYSIDFRANTAPATTTISLVNPKMFVMEL